MNKTNDNTRNYSLDLLRCFATIMVIMMHVVADNFYVEDPKSVNFIVLTFYNSLCRSAVPIFFMLSGAFSITTDIKKSVRKALHFILIFFLISLAYGIVDIIHCDEIVSVRGLLKEVIHYKYHLWFLPAYIIVLICSPVVNYCCLREKKYIKYICAIFTLYIIMQTINLFWGSNELVRGLVNIFPLTGGYIGYFVLGKLLLKTNFSVKQRRLIYTIGIISIFFIFVLTRAISIEHGKANEHFYNEFTIFVYCSAIFYFVLFKNLNISQRLIDIVRFISPHTLMIYLFHVVVIDSMSRYLDFKACSFL